MAVDPVCGMKVDEDNAEFQSAYGGKDFLLLLRRVRNQIDENPTRHVSAGAA